MVELGVGEHGDLRRQREQRAVGLVGLDHEPLARAPAGVGAGRAHGAADEVARGPSRSRRSACTSMLDVVVLPCVPVTAIVGRRRVSSPSSSARCSSRSPARAPRARGSPAGSRDETTSSAPAGTFAAAWPAIGAMPAARSAPA